MLSSPTQKTMSAYDSGPVVADFDHGDACRRHGGHWRHYPTHWQRLVDDGMAATHGNLADERAEWERVFALYKASPEYDAVNFGMDLAGFKTIFFWEYFHRLWGACLASPALPLLGFWMAGRIPRVLASVFLCCWFLAGFRASLDGGW